MSRFSTPPTRKFSEPPPARKFSEPPPGGDLAPVLDATDVIPEEERLAPYAEKTGFMERVLGSLSEVGYTQTPHMGPQVSPLPPAPALAKMLNITTEEAQGIYMKGQAQALRYMDAPELFTRGVVAYMLETEPARLVRKGYRAATFIPKADEPAKKFRFDDMIDMGIQAVKGGKQVDEFISPFRLIQRTQMTQAEIDNTNKWLERHPNIKKAYNIADLVTEIGIGIAFEYSLVTAARTPRAFISRWFDNAADATIKKGFRSTLKATLDDFANPRIDLSYPIPDDFIAKRFAEALPDSPTMEIMQAYAKRADVELTIGEWLSVVEAKVRKPRFLELMTEKLGYLPTINPDDITRELLMRSYAGNVIKRKLIPKKIADEMTTAVSYGKVTNSAKISSLDPIQIEQLVDDMSSYMAVSIEGKAAVNAVTATFRPQWATFDKLGLFKNYAAVEDANTFVMKLLDQREDFLDTLRKLYKKDLTDWGIEEQTTAWYVGQKKNVPKPVRDALSVKLGNDIDKYTEAVDFIENYVAQDKARYVDFLRDEAVRQGYIGPGTDVPVIENYVAWKLDDKAFQAAYSASFSKYNRTVPKNVWAPEFIKRRKLTEAQLNKNYDTVMREMARHEGRKLFIEPELHRLDAIITATDEYKKSPTFALWYEDWKKHSVFNHPAKSDVKWNETLNKVSEKVGRISGGRWEPSGRTFEQFTGRFRMALARGTLAGNTRSITKNFFQSALSTNIIGGKATAAGWASIYSDGGREILNTLFFTKARGPLGRGVAFGAFDVTNTKAWDKMMTYGGIAVVDKYFNTAGVVNGYLWKQITKSRTKMNTLYEIGEAMGYKKGTVRGSKFWDVTAEAIKKGHFKPDITNARKALYYTQWNYARLGAPAYMQSATGRLLGQYSTWPAHFITVHIPQLFKQSPLARIAGKTPTTIFGGAATLNEQMALFRYAAIAASVAYIGKEMGYRTDHMYKGATPTGRLLGKEVPFFVSPGLEFMVNLGALGVGLITGKEKMEAQGFKGMARSLRAVTPLGTAGTRTMEFLEGDAPLGTFLFSPIRKKKKKARLGIPGLGGARMPKL